MVADWGVAAAAVHGRASGLVRCCQCGKRCSDGNDWHGRFRCDDCAREGAERSRRQQQAQALETERLALVAAEVSEREAMWSMPLP